MRSLVRTALAVLAAALLAAGCSAGSTAQAPAGGAGAGALTIGLFAEPANLDFTRTDGAAIPQALLVNVYEGLVKLDQETGKIVPALAKSGRSAPTARPTTSRCASASRSPTASPFTADDAKFSIDRVKSADWTVSLKSGMSVVSSVEAVSPTARPGDAQPSPATAGCSA